MSMRRALRGIPALLCAVAAALPASAAGHAAAPTAGTLHEEARALLDRTARQWAGLLTERGVFQNPFPADLARGHGAFVPPMLAYALHRAGERRGDPALVAAAERAWPQSVDPVRASAFDMVGAAYAHGTPALSGDRRAQLASYLGRYGIPPNGRACLVVPTCYGNLRLVDALAVLSITGAGIRAADPAARLGDPARARAFALWVVNGWIPQIADHDLRARIAGTPVRGSYLSDPSMNPSAYHALSAFMLSEATAQLGAEASPAARRTQLETMDALAALVAPDGDMSYVGRGQGQVWVPAVTVAALANGARDAAAWDPVRAGRYLAAARRAMERLRTLHAGKRGLQLVPGGSGRKSTDGIDGYAHTVAYNGLALFALTEALDALGAIPAVPVGRVPSSRRLALRDEAASGLGIVSDGRTWLAVRRKASAVADLRFDSGAVAIKRRTARGWVDLLAPRPLAVLAPNTGGPSLLHRGRVVPLSSFGIQVRGRTIRVNGGYRARNRWISRVEFRWRLTRSGVRLTLGGANRGERFRMLAYTPAGSGRRGSRTLRAAGARWRFDRPIHGTRLRGYHSGPIERLDALEARFTAPKSGRVVLDIDHPPALDPRGSG